MHSSLRTYIYYKISYILFPNQQIQIYPILYIYLIIPIQIILLKIIYKLNMKALEFLNKQIYFKTLIAIKNICHQNNVDQSHGLPHAVQIALHVKKALDCMQNPEKIASQQQQNVILGALMHDIDDHKYFKTLDFQNARFILNQIKLNKLRSQKIIRMIQLVSFSKNGNNIYSQDPIYYYFPRYADRVQAIGLIGIYRTYQYSQKINTPFYKQNTPMPKSKQDIYQIIWGRDKQYMVRGGSSQSSIDHIFDKLLHIKLPQQIKNLYLQNLYLAGHQYMMEYILTHSQSGYQNAQQDLLLRLQKNNEKKLTQVQIITYLQ